MKMSEPAGHRVAVVTGGADAIGGAIVAALAAGDHTVRSLDQGGDPAVDLGREDEVRTTAFLVSDAAAALTGQVLCTDGGLILR
jgi:NAD(P)-dependent dehydrogenase (short-subunit alcohol dehydrogenase family)